MLLGVQHFMGQLFLLEQLGQKFGVLDRSGTQQYRLATREAVFHIDHDSRVFFLLGDIHEVVVILADHLLVGRNDHRFQTVDMLEFERFGIGRSGHAGKLAVQPEIILEGDGRQGLRFILDLDAFFRFHRLVQAVRPAATGHHAAGKFIDDDDFAVLHHVMLVAVIQGMRTYGRVEVMHQHDIGRVVQRRALRQHAVLRHQLFSVFMASFGQGDRMLLQVHPVVTVGFFIVLRLQVRNQQVDFLIQRRGIFGLAGDDQRRARLVDQDRIDFVDDGEVETAHHTFGLVGDHVVAQVIEAEFVIGAVGNVRGESLLLGVMRHLRKIAAHRQTEERMQASHPFRISLGEVVVHRNDVDALAGNGVQI